MLAETGHHFWAVQVHKGGHYGWQTTMRPLPETLTLLEEGDAFARLREGYFGLVVCHNMRDVLKVEEFTIPKILIFHNKISTEIALGGHQVSAEQYRSIIRERMARDRLTLVFISESKRRNCGLDGRVILPGINLAHYGGYTGEIEKVLRVGNLMKERDIMLGFSWQEEILRGIPSTLLGINTTVTESRVSESWDDLRAHYRRHRLFLNSTLHPWEDGYNLAMLEAMATGMPVISIANPSSPIVDGVNGYISQDTDYLRRRIQELLADRDTAIELGAKARETVEKQFPMGRFVERWSALFEHVVGQSSAGRIGHVSKTRAKGTLKSQGNRKKTILLCYTSYPATTGRYYEKSLKKYHNVLTCGPCITPEIIQAWDLGSLKEKPKQHDFHFPYPDPVNLEAVLASAGSGWQPDLFLWIETGLPFPPLLGLEFLRCPKACYFIDTHISLQHLQEHLQWAVHFDVVFLAQKAYIPQFKKAGMENVFWLPLACDPEIHGKRRVKKHYAIGFVGSINQQNPQRIALLDRLSNNFDVHVERCFLKDMARVFSASKIVFNNTVRDDLNMRVFEALCSGSMLLTDRARGSGLEELFQERNHLVIYDDDDLEALAEYYLDHEKEREAIAACGRMEVLAKHTYDHRVQEIMNRLEALVASGTPRFPPGVTLKDKSEGFHCAKGPDTVLCGQELEQQGCLTEAKEHYLEQLKKNPVDRDALVGLGRVLMQLQQWKEAESYLRRAVDTGPHWESIVLLGRCEMKSGKFQEALAHLESAGSHEGQDPSRRKKVLSLIGDCLVQMGDTVRAEASYLKALEVDARADEAWVGLGILHVLRGDYPKAADAFAEAANINPKNDRALSGMGLASWKTGQKEQALETFQKSLDINPENLTSLNHLLQCSYEIQKLEIPERYLKRYLDLHPLNLDVLYSLGGLYYQLEKYNEVQEIVETILTFQPDHEGAKELAGVISHKIGGCHPSSHPCGTAMQGSIPEKQAPAE
jgi:tetratricopeptide (TPR) repeat protein